MLFNAVNRVVYDIVYLISSIRRISGIDDTYKEEGSPLFLALNKVKCDKSAIKILEMLICSLIFPQEELNILLL